MKSKISTPVLFIAFNRTDTTQIVFDRIREVQPHKLYIAVDGPRSNKPGEEDLCQQVVEITKNVDWDCNAKYLIRDKNLGCKLSVTEAISWVLRYEDMVIVIEDDVVPAIPFFYFAAELLERYKDDDRIGMISGNNYTPIKNMDCDYLFSKYSHIWGWATWKRAWDKFDVDLPELEETINTDFPSMLFGNKKEKKYFKKYFKSWFEKIKNRNENAWGPQYLFYMLNNNLLSIVPKTNLASNIGLKSSRTDSISKKNKYYWPANNTFTLTKHPDKVEQNINYDAYHFKKHIDRKPPIFNRVFQKAKIMLKF